MRIALISEHASPLAVIGGVDAGGQNRHVAELTTTLAAHGHQVRVYTRRDDPTIPEAVPLGPGVTVEHVPAGPPAAIPKDELLPYMRQFGHWLRRKWLAGDFRPDVVHAHFWMSGVAALEAVGRSRLPVLLTYHALGSVKRRYQGAADTSPPERIATERQLGLSVDRVIAQCADEVAELNLLGIPGDTITVIPSGVDLGRFTPDGPSAARPPGRRRILTVGRLVARKGFDDLIRVLPGLADTELVIVGGPPEGISDDAEAHRLRELAAEQDVADRVRLVGAVPGELMPAMYRSADLLACTPWYEPFGLTPLEAMACGVPVVAYEVGGLAESVADRRTGRLVAPGGVRELSAALRLLLGDAQRLARYRRAALERARARYGWDHAATDLAEVYADVAARRHSPIAEVAR